MSSIKLSEKQTISISLRLLKANLSINVARFGKMNPYVSVMCGSKTYLSSIAKNADCTPEWNEDLEIELDQQLSMEITLYHSAYIIGDVMIGKCSLTSDMIKKGLAQESLPIISSNGNAGSLLVSLILEEEKESKLNTNTTLEILDEREDLYTRLAELNLQREELYFYKRKYKQKISRFSEEKSFIKQKHKHAVFDSMSFNPSSSDSMNTQEMEELILEKELLAKERNELKLLRDKIEQDVSLLIKQKQKLAVYTRLIHNSCPSLCECNQQIDRFRKRILKHALSQSDNLPLSNLKIPDIKLVAEDTLALKVPQSPREIRLQADVFS